MPKTFVYMFPRKKWPLKIRNSELSTISYQSERWKKNILTLQKLKDIEPHCAVILWFYSPVLQIISFYLPTLPQSDFLKDIRNNFTSCNIIIQKKGCKLTKKQKKIVFVNIKPRKKSKTKHNAWKFIHETQIHNFCFGFFFHRIFFHLGVSL